MSKLKNGLLKKLLKFAGKTKLRYYIDFFYFSIGFFFSTFLALLTTILINKNLSKAELGEFSYNKSILELFAYFFTLTIYRSYLRFNINGVSIVLKRIVSLITKIAILLLIALAFYLTNSIMATLFAFFIIFEERTYFTRSLMNTVGFNKIKIGAAFLTVSTVFFFCQFGRISADKVLFSYGVGFLIALLFYKKKYPENNDKGKLTTKTILLFSIPALGSILIKWSMDVTAQFLLKEYFDFVEVSKFAVALRVLLIVKLFSNLLMMYYPMVYYREIQKRNKVLISKMRFGISLLMFLISLLAFYFAKEIYWLMGASSYLEYLSIFRILLIAEFIFLLGNLWGTYLGFALKTHISLFIYATGSLTNILILLFALKEYGINVAAYSILISNIIILILVLFFVKRQESKYLSILEPL